MTREVESLFIKGLAASTFKNKKNGRPLSEVGTPGFGLYFHWCVALLLWANIPTCLGSICQVGITMAPGSQGCYECFVTEHLSGSQHNAR